jgi:hypothetical protein
MPSSAASFLYPTDSSDGKSECLIEGGWDIVEHPTLPPPPSQSEDVEHWTRAMFIDAKRKWSSSATDFCFLYVLFKQSYFFLKNLLMHMGLVSTKIDTCSIKIYFLVYKWKIKWKLDSLIPSGNLVIEYDFGPNCLVF